MIDYDALLSGIRKAGAKKVLVQVPEGLKPRAREISDALGRGGIESIISVEPCFGACDLRDRDAKQLGCGALVHIGHSDMGIKAAVPVIFQEYCISYDPVVVLKREKSKLERFARFGLVSTVQHLDSLGKAQAFLNGLGKSALIGRSARMKDGQVTGCDYSSARSIEKQVECFLIIGSGLFHPLGLASATDKPVLFLDVESGRIDDMHGEKAKLETKRMLRVEKARSLGRFAVFLSTKPGQMDVEAAKKAKESLMRKGKEAVVVSADALAPEKIMGMGFDALVNTACPRILNDNELFRLLILEAEDVEKI